MKRTHGVSLPPLAVRQTLRPRWTRWRTHAPANYEGTETGSRIAGEVRQRRIARQTHCPASSLCPSGGVFVLKRRVHGRCERTLTKILSLIRGGKQHCSLRIRFNDNSSVFVFTVKAKLSCLCLLYADGELLVNDAVGWTSYLYIIDWDD